MRLTDTHCHLYLEHFADDLDEVIQRAVDAGVEKMVVPGIDLGTSRAALGLAEKYSQVYAAVGIHPNSGSEWDQKAADEVEGMAAEAKVVAIGEIGLDHYWDTTPHDVQGRVFQEQLELAAKLDKPIIVHDREATSDVLDILARWVGNLAKNGATLAERPGVMHSFSGNREEAETAMSMGFYLGVCGPVTFKNAGALHALVEGLPGEKLLIETDSPYLTPHPHRGKRNEPSMVGLVNGKISELKDVSPQDVAEATYSNAERLFRW